MNKGERRRRVANGGETRRMSPPSLGRRTWRPGRARLPSGKGLRPVRGHAVTSASADSTPDRVKKPGTHQTQSWGGPDDGARGWRSEGRSKAASAWESLTPATPVKQPGLNPSLEQLREAVRLLGRFWPRLLQEGPSRSAVQLEVASSLPGRFVILVGTEPVSNHPDLPEAMAAYHQLLKRTDLAAYPTIVAPTRTGNIIADFEVRARD